MSARHHSDPVSTAGANPKSKKKNKKKKAAGTKPDSNGDPAAVNGAKAMPEVEDEAADDDDEVEHALDSSESQPPAVQAQAGDNLAQTGLGSNGLHTVVQSARSADPAASNATSERLEALARERDTLRAEVTQLRKSLESITEKHEEDKVGLQEQLEETKSGKEHAESQYRNLLGKVNTIKAQLGERLKADADELQQARAQLEELEERNRNMNETNESLHTELSRVKSLHEKQTQDITDLRSRGSLSQQNWIKERDELIQKEAYAREEFETAKQAMQDWEVLAMEERSLRENLEERVAELDDQLSQQRETYEKAAAERDSQSLTVDGLQRALQDIQDARKKELRELVENSQAQLEQLRKQLTTAEEELSSSRTELDQTRKELDRALPFEKEVKEKNLLIGKLRHEAVILNDHLTKALRFLKQRKPEDMVDRQIVTNHLLHFLALDRSDPKKFQVLQLIAALLSWTEEEKEQSGLARPGASHNNLRIPLSPFRRTPSTPSLNTDPSLEHGASRESLAELWSDFLEREAQEGSNRSRRPSSAVASPESERPGSGHTRG